MSDPLSELCIYSAMVGADVLVLAFLVTYIVQVENRGKRNITAKAVFSPINTLLITSFICLILFNISFAAMPINDEYSLTKKLCFVIERFCLSTIMFSAMAYFWLTTHGIIDIVYPKLYQGLKIAIMASPLLFYLQTVLAIVYSLYTQELPAPAAVRLAGQAAVLISAVGVVGFDIVFMVTFVKYLLKARKEQHLEDLKLQAIAKHSLGGSVCIILSVAVYVLGIGFDSGVAFAVSPCFQSFGFWILVGLKVSLNGIRNGVVSRGGAPHSSVQDVSGDSSNSGFSHDQSKTTEDRSVQKGSVTVAISVRDHMR